MSRGRCGERLVDLLPRRPRTFRAVPPLYRRGDTAEPSGVRTAGEIQVVLVVGIGRLVRTDRRFERDAVGGEPLDHLWTGLDEPAEGLGSDRVADLGVQVGEHRVGAVVESGFALYPVPPPA